MDNRRLGKTDIEISPIGLGCWQFSQGKGMAGRFWGVVEQQTADDIVKVSMKEGINWFDTAEMYGGGRSESVLSRALHDLDVAPGRVVIATKWMPILRTANNLHRTIGQRISHLDGYPIDLHQVHVPFSVSSIGAQMRAMARLLREGKIRSVGVSNFSARQMAAASAALQREGLVLASNQVRISLMDRRIETNGVLETARRLGVTLIAYSPLAQGILTGRFHDDPHEADHVAPMRKGAVGAAGRGGYSSKGLKRTEPLVAELKSIGSVYGATPAQIALSWLVSFYGDTVVAIPGASKVKQAEDNAAAMLVRLKPAELARLDELSRTYR